MLPSLTQCCATLEPDPGTSRPLPKAPQQSTPVLRNGLPAPCESGPRVERGLILCALIPWEMPLGHLFCPFLRGAVIIVFALSVLALSSQCAVNFC